MNSKPESELVGAGYDSGDCVNVVFEGPGDNTIRPCRPEMLEHLKAEREKILKWGGWLSDEWDEKHKKGQNGTTEQK